MMWRPMIRLIFGSQPIRTLVLNNKNPIAIWIQTADPIKLRTHAQSHHPIHRLFMASYTPPLQTLT